ncbi:conserved hypothetical protein [Gammaproteobacteria bacterium]
MSRISIEHLDAAKKKVIFAIALVARSVEKLELYDINKIHTIDEIEPYDALCDRFIRAVEVCIKYFRTYEYIFFVVQSDSLRDVLNIMEKTGLITNTPIWLDMRDIRNRIVHDYSPEQIKSMYDRIMNDFFVELKYFEKKITCPN